MKLADLLRIYKETTGAEISADLAKATLKRLGFSVGCVKSPHLPKGQFNDGVKARPK